MKKTECQLKDSFASELEEAYRWVSENGYSENDVDIAIGEYRSNKKRKEKGTNNGGTCNS